MNNQRLNKFLHVGASKVNSVKVAEALRSVDTSETVSVNSDIKEVVGDGNLKLNSTRNKVSTILVV